MSENVCLSKSTEIRLPTIKQGLLQKWTRKQIGEACNVSEKTIQRDIGEWVQTDDFVRWLRELWLDYQQKLEDDDLVFRELTKLFIKSMVETVKADVSVDADVNVSRKDDIDALLGKFKVLFPAAQVDEEPTQEDGS